jgi:hypothetical protein
MRYAFKNEALDQVKRVVNKTREYGFEIVCEFMIGLPASDFEPLVWEEQFSKEELINNLSLAYSKFYKRPSYIWHQLFKVKTPAALFRKFKREEMKNGLFGIPII